MTQDCHYDFKLQAEYLQLVGSEMARKAGLGGSFGLTFLFSLAYERSRGSCSKKPGKSVALSP